MTVWLWGMLVFGLAAALSVAGMLIVRRSVTLELLESHNEVAGFIYAVIGVLYAVLLAFVVVVVWQQHEDAEHQVEREANKLGDLFQDAGVWPDEVRAEFQAQIRTYAQRVMEEEWPAMARGEDSPATWVAYNRLWQNHFRIGPQTAQERAWYTEMIGDLNELGDYRRLRLLSSHKTVPGIMWGVLIAGGVITVTFSYFFGLRNVWAHMLMIVGLSGIVSLALFLILALDHPFRGFARIEPEAFRQLVDALDRWLELRGGVSK